MPYLPLDEHAFMHVRRATAGDAEAVSAIYNWYTLNTIITFETDVVSPHEMSKRIQKNLMNYDWLVAELNQEVIGYACYGPFRARGAYYHTVESTVYLSQANIGKGFGTSLYAKLIASVRDHGFREVIGVVALPNPQSIALHRKMGFAEAGVLKKVGHKFDKYIDIGLWQLSLA